MLKVANHYPIRALLTYFGNMVQRDVKKKSLPTVEGSDQSSQTQKKNKLKNQYFIIECVCGGGDPPPVPRLTR